MSENIYKESRLRSILKAFTWRILATLTTMTIAFLITGEVATAITIGGIEFFAKMFIYYGHERAWQMIPRGGIRSFINRLGFRKRETTS